MVEPRMLIVSSETVSPGAEGFVLFFGVILTALKAVFICGETEVIVPCTIVPFFSSIVTVSLAHFMRNLDYTVRVSHQVTRAQLGCSQIGRALLSTLLEILASHVLNVPYELHFGAGWRSMAPPVKMWSCG